MKKLKQESTYIFYNRLLLRKYGYTKIFFEIDQRRAIIQTAVQWKKSAKIQSGLAAELRTWLPVHIHSSRIKLGMRKKN
jgi:hypothetical protein